MSIPWYFTPGGKKPRSPPSRAPMSSTAAPVGTRASRAALRNRIRSSPGERQAVRAV